MKPIVFFMSLLLIACSLEAQNLIGRLVDYNDTTKPIAGAIVRLESVDGCLLAEARAGSNGSFALVLKPEDSNQSHRFIVQALGYESLRLTLRLSDTDMNLGAIRLQKEAKALGEVVVQAKAQIHKVGGYMVFPSLKARQQTLNGYQFLRRLSIPELRIDAVNKSIRTQSGEDVLVLINDKRATMTELMTLRPKYVSRVEYIDQYSAEYGEGAWGAILKVYVRKADEGIALGVNLTSGLTTMATEGYGYMRYNTGKHELGATLEHSYIKIKKRSISQSDRYEFADASAYEIEREGINTPLAYSQNRLTLHYNITEPKRYIFQTTLSGKLYNSPERGHRQLVKELGHSPYYVETKPTEHYFSPDLDVFYSQEIKGGHKLTLNAHSTLIKTNYGYLYQEDRGQAYKYSTKGTKLSQITEARYQHRFSSVLLNAGVRHLYGVAVNKYHGDNSQEDRMKNQELYLYAQLSGKFARLNYTAGIGASMNAVSRNKLDEHTWVLRPRLSLSMPISDIRLQYDLSISPVVPSLSMLSPVRQRANRWEYREGNPNLKMYALLSNKLTLRKAIGANLFLSSVFGANYSAMPIQTTIKSYNNGADRALLKSYENMGSYTKVYGLANLSWQAIPDVLTCSAQVSHSYYRSIGEGFKHDLHHTALSLDAELSLGKWSLSASLNSRDKSLSGEVVSISAPNASLSLMYNLGRWHLGLIGNNLFLSKGPWQKEEWLSRLHRHTETLLIPSMGNVVMFTASWSWSKGRKHQAGRTTIQNRDTESGILKF